MVIDSLPVHDSIPDTYSLYLPTNFVTDKTWPILFVCDLEGNAKRALSMFVNAAEEEGYILAAPNQLLDTIALSKNILRVGRMMSSTIKLLPIDNDRIYTAGFSNSGRFANVVPVFIKGVAGVISCGSSITNTELLSSKNPFHFIGIANRQDYAYTDLLKMKKVLNGLKFDNQIILYDGASEWPKTEHLQKALRLFKLNKMAKGNLAKDEAQIQRIFESDNRALKRLISENRLILADYLMSEMLSVYRLHGSIDSLKNARREFRKQKAYRVSKRSENSAFFKESFLRDDYQYYLEEDILTYNFNNLGWWNYQMGELQKFMNSQDEFKKRMGYRMKSYINALIEDAMDAVKAERRTDEDALVFLSMLKTITSPYNFEHYLDVISISAKNEDFGTSLFYLEELLKKGFKDLDTLYNIEHTALFRISPEFNELVSKYLKDARYEVIEE